MQPRKANSACCAVRDNVRTVAETAGSIFWGVHLKSGVGKEYIKSKWTGSSVGYLPAGRQGASASGFEYRVDE
ncbi:MAG: hypothetical protein IT250_07335 [Chitinophagaceae bacterium]|nr:hypothetical protein [Chitinophagaceae bacterium]